LGLLFEHLSELEGDYEFDKIGICCDWTEYKNIYEAEKEYIVSIDGGGRPSFQNSHPLPQFAIL
jgi:hypothetical protein